MIWSSGMKSRTAAVPTTMSQSIGESPSPGRFAVRFESVSVSPFFIFFAATMLFRATAMFFISEGDGVLMRLPRAESTLRTAFTIAASSAGSSDAAWSGPAADLSRVKCFSIIVAPRAVAATGTSMPAVWSL